MRDPEVIAAELDAAKLAFIKRLGRVERRDAPYEQNCTSLHDSIQAVARLEEELSTSRGYVPAMPLLNRTQVGKLAAEYAALLAENDRLRAELDALRPGQASLS